MKSKERVIRAIEFKKPDRVPFYDLRPWRSDLFHTFYYPAKCWQPEEPYYPYIEKYLLLIGNWKPKRPLPFNWTSEKRKMMDEFGCIWEAEISNTIGECTGHPIDGWKKLKTFKIPDPYRRERFETLEGLRKIFGKDKFVVGHLGNCIWERSHFLRGFIQIMQDLILEPKKVCELIDKIMPWYLGLIEMYSQLGYDGVIATDDWGMQKGLMISPQLWRDIFKPRYAKLIEATHKKGMKFFLHSCGDIEAIIPDLIEIGLDVLQKDDPECIGLEKLAELCAKKLCIYSPLDIQRVLPKASKSVIRKEVKRMIKILGSCGGGLMGMVYTQPYAIGLTFTKFIIMEKAFRKFGRYDDKL